MQLGIFAKTFDGTAPDTVLAAAAQAGYAAVQYNMACSGLPSMPDQISTVQARAVAEAARAAAITVSAVSATYNMIHPNRAVRDRGQARLDVLASHCRAMSAPMITLCTGTRDPQDQWRTHPENASKAAWADLLSEMERALDTAERYDIVLGIEPELANVISSAAKARDLIRELSNPRIRVVLDPANLFEQASLSEQRRLVSSASELLGERIAMGHAKDRAADGGFVAAGKGVVDFHHYVSGLKAAGFAGPLVSHGLSAQEAPGVAGFLRGVCETAGVELS